jgi:replicative DNA helicase
VSKLSLNTEYFESIIGHQALTNEYYLSIIVDHVKPSYFHNPGVRLILDIVKDFFVKRSAIPKASEIRAYLSSERDTKLFTETIRSFKSLDSTYNLEELVENTERFFKERAIYEAVKKTVDEFGDKDNPGDSNETLKLFDAACNISLVDSLGFDYFNQIDRHIADLKELAEFIPTGWKWLDQNIGGGLLKTGRALYVVAGPTNVGKSIVLGNIAVNVAKQGKTVLIVSLEMSEAVYGKRVSSQLSKIPLNELSTQTETLKNFLVDYKSQNKDAKIIIKEYPPKGITVNHLKAYIQKLIHKGIRPDVIVLDYLNLMDAAGDGDNSYEQVKQITEQLRALTYIFKCPIVSATQVNRSGYEGKPALESTSESMGLAHTADVIIPIWQEDGDKELGVLKLGLSKNRFGPNFGATSFQIDYPTLSLTENEDYFAKTENTNAAKVDGVLEKLRQ